MGLAVDDSGNLWVADSGNGRVLRFPAPFSVAAGAIQTADMVLGQTASLMPRTRALRGQTMHTPYGLALLMQQARDGQTHLAVSDLVLNRVLVFETPFSMDNPHSPWSGSRAFRPAGLPISWTA